MEGHKGEYWPLQRSNHAACCLNFGDPQPRVFVTGGVVPEGVVNDAWLFNVATRKWQNVIDWYTVKPWGPAFFIKQHISVH